MSDDLPLFRMAWDGDDVKNVVDSVTRGSHWANGPYVDRFESRIEEYVGVDHAVVFNSGTTALVGALNACGVGQGDEVIVPSFTFISTANAVQLVGAEPVFADIETDRYGLDPEDVRERITEDTAAIVPVHYAGAPCHVGKLQDVATAHDLVLIEDAAEAFGAEHKSAKVGTYGDVAMFSFCQNKIIATGEGGAAVTDDDEIAEQLNLIRSHGRASMDYFGSAEGGDYVALGSNYRMPDVVAALGVAQEGKVENLISRRRAVASLLSDGLNDVSHISTPGDPVGDRHVYQLYTVTFDETVDRDGVAASLSEAGVASKVYFDPVHRSEYYRSTFDEGTVVLPTTDGIAARVLSLPMYPELAQEDAERVVSAVREAVEANTG